MNKKLYKLMNWPEIEGIVYSESDDPHALLGAHTAGSSVLVQTFQPGAVSVRLQLSEGDKSYKILCGADSGEKDPRLRIYRRISGRFPEKSP